MSIIFEAIAGLLSFCYDITGNYGLAIMLLTLAVMVILTPLTLKGTRSMIAMQRLQPEMKKLQAKYRDDRQKLNEEMLKFYKEHNINPVGGCLPLLLQTPVFIILYRVLHGMTNPHPFGEDMGRSFGLAAGNRSAVFERFGTFDPGYLDEGSRLYKDLSVVREMQSFGLDLAKSASQRLSEGFGSALPYLLLIAIIGVTAWYQQRQIQGRNPQMQSQINPQQQMLMKIFPYFLPVISFTLPAGIVLYFLVSNLYRIGQQGFITRTMYRDEHGNPIFHGSGGDDGKDGGGKGKQPDKPKGLLASLKETMAESGPRVGPNANGGSKAKPSPKAGGKAGSNGGGKAGGTKGGGSTARASGSGSTARGKAGGKGTPPKGGSPGGAKRSKGGAPDADEAGDVSAPEQPSPRGGPSPSRQPPAPNPNRSRTKKKRR